MSIKLRQFKHRKVFSPIKHFLKTQIWVRIVLSLRLYVKRFWKVLCTTKPRVCQDRFCTSSKVSKMNSISVYWYFISCTSHQKLIFTLPFCKKTSIVWYGRQMSCSFTCSRAFQPSNWMNYKRFEYVWVLMSFLSAKAARQCEPVSSRTWNLSRTQRRINSHAAPRNKIQILLKETITAYSTVARWYKDQISAIGLLEVLNVSLPFALVQF